MAQLSDADFVRATQLEVSYWGWLFELIDGTPGLAEPLKAYVRLRQMTVALRDASSEDAIRQLRPVVESLVSTSAILCADSSKGGFVRDLAAQRPQFAADVLQAFLGTLDPRSVEHIEAIIAAVLHARGISNRANAEVKALDKLEKRWREFVDTTSVEVKKFKSEAADALAVGKGRLDRAAAENERKLSLLRDLLDKTEQRLDRLKTHSEADLNTHAEKLTTRVDELSEDLRSAVSTANANLLAEIHEIETATKDRLDSMERAYLESTALKAPVTFWSEKSADHAKKARHLMFASVIGGVVVLASLAVLAWQILPAGTIISIRGIGVFLAVSALAIWLLRVSVRLWLLQIHLEADARERVVMAKTYLSLLQEGLKTSDDERKIVIQALFKRSATGLTKDEATPLSALEIVSKVIGGAK